MQRKLLKSAGMTADDLKAAGFQWKSSAWVGSDHALYDKLQSIIDGFYHQHDANPAPQTVRICTARKVHECAECGRPIGSGEEMMMRSQAEGGEIQHTYLCTCCWGYSDA
jgi:hypothetical protein